MRRGSQACARRCARSCWHSPSRARGCRQRLRRQRQRGDHRATTTTATTTDDRHRPSRERRSAVQRQLRDVPRDEWCRRTHRAESPEVVRRRESGSSREAGSQRRWRDAPVLGRPVRQGDRRGRALRRRADRAQGMSADDVRRAECTASGSIARSFVGCARVSFEDWIFSIHLLIAATLVGSLVMSWIVVVALRTVDTAGRDAQPATGWRWSRRGAIVVGPRRRDRLRDLARDPARRLPPVGRLGDRGDRPLGIATVGDAALLRRVRETRREGESARRFRPDRLERRAHGVEPDLDRAPAPRPGVGSDRADRHRHDLEAGCLSCSPRSGPTTRASRFSCTSSARPSSSAPCWRARPRSSLARGETRLLRLGYFSLLLVGLPGLILLRLAGEWLYRLQDWDDLPDQIERARLAQHRIHRRRLGRASCSSGACARRHRRLPAAQRQRRHRVCSRRRWSSRSSSSSPTSSPCGR